MDLLTQQASKVKIIQSIHAPLNNPIVWKQRVRQNFKIGIEFECNLDPNYLKCKSWIDQACDMVTCKLDVNNLCKKDCKGLYKQIKDNEVCEIGVECKHYGVDCDIKNCVDFVGDNHKPGPCSKQNCKEFVPFCERCGINDASSIRSEITSILKPTKNPKCIGEYGVECVQNDGSLINGGVEVITAGRHYDYDIIQRQNKMICNLLIEKGGFINGRCGGHMHTLLSYDPKWSENARANHNPEIDVVEPNKSYSEIEEPIPSIICANITQIVRRFAAELTWITCATAINDDIITRYSQFRKGIIIDDDDKDNSKVKLLLSPQNMDIMNIGLELHKKFSGKYSMLNYDYCKFVPNRDMVALHLEFRTPDMHFVPTAHTAIAGLLYAIWIKATDISEYGLMAAGESEWMKEEIRLFQAINNMGKCCDKDGVVVVEDIHEEERLSCPPTDCEMRDLSIRTVAMLKFFKRQLLTINENLYGILLSLAKEPIALRLHKGQKYTEIEQHLSSIHAKEKPTNNCPTDIESKIIKIMNLGEIISQNEDQWIDDVTNRLSSEYSENYSVDDIKNVINKLERHGITHFDDDTGTFMFFQKGGIC